ncbi:MAG: alpha/beta hydrolase [Anaerolineae bacterium]|nr:alpha/beta hydrolase [Anaerolineae bacterium]
MPFADLRTGARLHYEDQGSGTPVIVLHGMLGTARAHLGRVMDWLSADCRVIGPTLRGYGESTPKPRDFPPDFYRRDAEDLLAFLDAIDLSPAHILGYSDGGEVALIAAGLQPQRFRSVSTIGAVGYFGPEMRASVQRMYPVDWVTEEQKALHAMTEPVPIIMQWIRSAKMLIDSGGDASVSLAPHITCPVLLMLGEQDHLNPPSCANVFLARVPDGRLEMFDCAHPIHDQQWDAFQRVFGSFLRETDSL